MGIKHTVQEMTHCTDARLLYILKQLVCDDDFRAAFQGYLYMNKENLK